jgi:uncharacterized protein YjiS (DUF1127 family)
MLRTTAHRSWCDPGRVEELAAVRQPDLRTIAWRARHTVLTWIERAGQRQALAELDDHLLKDIGISPEQARRESAKPFWR